VALNSSIMKIRRFVSESITIPKETTLSGTGELHLCSSILGA
jgi:hypothetical protein